MTNLVTEIASVSCADSGPGLRHLHKELGNQRFRSHQRTSVEFVCHELLESTEESASKLMFGRENIP